MRLLVTGADGLLGSAVVRGASERGHEVTACVRTADRASGPGSRASDVASDAGRVSRLALDVTASRPYRPGDPPDSINLYGKSKWMGGEEVRMSSAPWLVVRTSWLYGAGGGNFVDGILEAARTSDRLRIVSDQRGRPTWTESLAPGRTLHRAERGEATWHDLAAEALRLAGIESELVPVTTEEWGAPGPRPRYSVLDLEEAEAALGYRMSEWRESLRRYLGGEDEMAAKRGASARTRNHDGGTMKGELP